jgi:hypothetical protein
LEPQASSNIFRQEGEFWTVWYGGLTVYLRDAKGLQHIACLLREPSREFHVLDLLAMTDSAPAVTPAWQVTGDLHVAHLPEDRPLPDQQAKIAYQRRLDELQDELAAAQRYNDAALAARTQGEIDLITSELAVAYRVSQHARKNSSEVEKARKAITSRIRTVLGKIQQSHPALWQHLCSTLKTGTFCSYNPEKPITWQFS